MLSEEVLTQLVPFTKPAASACGVSNSQCPWSQQQWFHIVLFQWVLWKVGHLYVR